MKKGEIISMESDILVQCDNPECDYTVPTSIENPDDCGEDYINKPCPKCGENLLTMEDYIQYVKLVKGIKWINKWFGWIYYLLPKKNKENPSVKEAHVHKGIHIKDSNDKLST